MGNKINNNQNILWVDYAKCFGIFLMIFAHLLSANCHLYRFIYLFHMPLFFIIGGYLYKQKSYKENFSKIIWGLLIPYFIYQFLYLPIKLCNLVFYHNAPFFETLIKIIQGIIFATSLDDSFFITNCVPCWFIMTMVILRIIFNFIKINQITLFIISIIAIIISKFLMKNDIVILFCISCAILAMPYYALGVFFKEKNINLNLFMHKSVLIITTFIGIYIMNLILHYNGVIKMSRSLEPINNENPSLILMYIAGIIGSFLVILFSNLFKEKINFVDKISKNTLFIIFFHWFILFFIRWSKIPLHINLLDNIVLKLVLIFILATLLLYLCYLVILVLEKKCPLILGKYIPKINEKYG